MRLDDVKKLHQKKYRSQFGYYLVEGEHLILELNKSLANNTFANPITLYATPAYADFAEGIAGNVDTVLVTERQMSQLSDTKTPQGIIARVPMPRLCHTENAPHASKERCIYLHEIQDPGNLGTIMRTLAWFGNFRLLLSPHSVDPFNSKVVRSSMGAIFHVPIELDVELSELKHRFSTFAYLDMKGRAVNTPSFGAYDCYLFGNEARGVPRVALDDFNADPYTIPGCGTIDSLNVASALNMCVFQLSLG